MAVACYLKRRQYVDSDGPLKPGLRLSQTPEEMAASLAGERGAPDSGVRATSLRAPRRRHASSSAHVTLRLHPASPSLAGVGFAGIQHACQGPRIPRQSVFWRLFTFLICVLCFEIGFFHLFIF